jgi:hypothetical protein
MSPNCRRIDVGGERSLSTPADEQPAGQSRSITVAIAWPKPMHMHATP